MLDNSNIEKNSDNADDLEDRAFRQLLTDYQGSSKAKQLVTLDALARCAQKAMIVATLETLAKNKKIRRRKRWTLCYLAAALFIGIGVIYFVPAADLLGDRQLDTFSQVWTLPVILIFWLLLDLMLQGFFRQALGGRHVYHHAGGE